MPAKNVAVAFAPASIGNVAVGFDMLGLAIAGPGDRVTATRDDGDGLRIEEVRDPAGRAHSNLPCDPERNTAAIAAASLWQAAGETGGVSLLVEKGIPLSSGMGSSAASAVAGAMAVNALLEAPLPVPDLLPHALAGERFASGSMHADNVAPSLLGGLVLCPPVLHPSLVPIRIHAALRSVLLHPELEINTSESRSRLQEQYPLELWLAQQGYLAGFIMGMERGDTDLIRRSLKDVIIEPQRAAAVPGFASICGAAMEAGALGASISGSGPSLFALTPEAAADGVAAAMKRACEAAGHACQAWISPLDAPGAVVERAA